MNKYNNTLLLQFFKNSINMFQKKIANLLNLMKNNLIDFKYQSKMKQAILNNLIVK